MTGWAAANASTAAALSLASMALTTFLRAVRTMERALTLRRRRCSEWRARFFADLMLAKVKLRKCLGWKKTRNYAGNALWRQPLSSCRTVFGGAFAAPAMVRRA